MPDWSTVIQPWVSHINTPTAVNETIAPITDFRVSISELLDVESFTQWQIDMIYKILQLEIPENEQVNILLFISPQHTIHDLKALKEIYNFFLEFWVHSWIIENLDWVDISSVDISFLNSEDFVVFDKDRNTFFNCVYLVLAWASISMLDAYRKTQEERSNARNTGRTNISPITFKIFEKRIKALDTWASIKAVTKWWVNIKLTSGIIINIWAKCLTWKNIGINQQNIAIRWLWCTRHEWINA